MSTMKVIYKLNMHQLDELYQIYQQQWWTQGRSLEDTRKVVEGSQVVIGLVDSNEKLQAFVRVLTDYTFKAFIFDLIVAEENRNKGLARQLMQLVRNHEDLVKVKHFELYCLPDMFEFYQKFGFSEKLDNVTLMRCSVT